MVLYFKDYLCVKALNTSDVFLYRCKIDRGFEKIFNDFFGGNEICRIFATAKAKDGPFV